MIASVYVTGSTWSSDFPHTQGNHSSSATDVFVSKLDGNLSQLQKSLFLGGTNANGLWEYGVDICESSSGNIILIGSTMSTDFSPITANAYQPNQNGSGMDQFVTKFDQDLLVSASTYFGGSQFEGAYSNGSCDVNSLNEIFIAGNTHSAESQGFPMVSGSFDGSYNGDAYVSGLNSGLSTLEASTYYGGSESDLVHDLKIDHNDKVFICGQTFSSNLPMTEYSFQGVYTVPSDGFVAKLDPNLSLGYIHIVENPLDKKEISVFPNPCRIETFVNFSIDKRSDVSISIADMKGRKLASTIQANFPKGDFQYKLNLTDLGLKSQQLYLINISIENEEKMTAEQIKLIAN